MSRASRRFLAALVSVLATVGIFITLLAVYANHVLVSPGSFSNRAVSALHSRVVESLIVQTVTDRLVADAGDETSLRPAIQAAVVQAVSSTLVDREFRAAAESLHGELVSGTANELTLTLPDIGSAIASNIGSGYPVLAQQVRGIGTITVLDVRIPPSSANDVHDLVSAGQDSSELLIGTVVLVLLALTISPNRRRTLVGLGLGATGSGLLVVAIYLAGRGIIVNEFSTPDARTAAHALWGAYLGELETSGFALAGAGAVIAWAAWCLG
jgi:hypothetical protein